ncbi:MAG TPA: hypothetical protein VKY33_06290 [Flavobacterium sp.]|nr:hypothetical protein [Flavobacterium sp.]
MNGILNELVMKMLIRNIIKFLLIFTTLNGLAQEPSFYIRSLRSIHLENKPSVLQPITFNDVDVVYNKIAQFIDQNIIISAPGNYEVSGFVNINPGVMGSNLKDSITIELLLINNHQTAKETVLATTHFTYNYGNFDVAAGIHIEPVTISLNADDKVSLCVKILPESTVEINKSSKYHHINKPTGMEQIAGVRIAKVP